MALAIHRSCFYPALKFSPPSDNFVSNELFIIPYKQHLSTTDKISSSVFFPVGSKFSLSVPSNIVESYIMIVIFSLSYLKGICFISLPSIIIYPLEASKILNKLIVMVDLPAPVLPTTPILVLG